MWFACTVATLCFPIIAKYVSHGMLDKKLSFTTKGTCQHNLTTLLAAPNSGSPFCIIQASFPACNSKLYKSPHTPERTHILYPHLRGFFVIVILDTHSAKEGDICSSHDKFSSKGRHKDALLILSSTGIILYVFLVLFALSLKWRTHFEFFKLI